MVSNLSQTPCCCLMLILLFVIGQLPLPLHTMSIPHDPHSFKSSLHLSPTSWNSEGISMISLNYSLHLTMSILALILCHQWTRYLTSGDNILTPSFSINSLNHFTTPYSEQVPFSYLIIEFESLIKGKRSSLDPMFSFLPFYLIYLKYFVVYSLSLMYFSSPYSLPLAPMTLLELLF